MEQILSDRIKIIDPSIVKILEHVKSIKCYRHGNLLIAKKVSLETCKSPIFLSTYKKVLLQFSIPHILRDFIGEKVNVYRRTIGLEKDELFCIEPIDFGFIKFAEPYFTISHFNVPIDYVDEHLNERAESMMACFHLTSEDSLRAGMMKVFVTERKEVVSSPLDTKGRTLRARISTGIIRMIDELGKDITKFKYIDTIPEIDYKFGVMFFKEEVDGQDIPAVR